MIRVVGELHSIHGLDLIYVVILSEAKNLFVIRVSNAKENTTLYTFSLSYGALASDLT